ncbi:30S ribosomal protein S3, chloroplastic [Ananas comosus]|uniref:30S ribosomal protein S3, chloroplastic n=1 Tax=Ananas comosus TaxID=4615 RepID=A0A199VAQ4_ANACO|nr:30S ribosomal protein S3, chloroplastic [Ananas comosus]
MNPLGFRLGTTQSHHSFWFTQPKNYSAGLQEDEKIRNCIKNYVQKNRKISSGFEGIAQGQTRGIEELQMNVQKEFHSVNRRLNIAITRVEKPYGQPNILAEYIALQLKNRVSFRKAMKKAIELTEQTDTKGIQVQIAGRIDGKEIARVEWIREGRVPYKQFALKLIILPIPFELFMEY